MGLLRQDRHRRPGREAGRIPSAAWKKDYCEAVAERAPCVDDGWFTQAWFQMGPFQLQPSELAKIVVIVALASVIAHFDSELDLGRLDAVLGALGIPMALILLQPDLGTALVFVAVGWACCWSRRPPPAHPRPHRGRWAAPSSS